MKEVCRSYLQRTGKGLGCRLRRLRPVPLLRQGTGKKKCIFRPFRRLRRRSSAAFGSHGDRPLALRSASPKTQFFAATTSLRLLVTMRQYEVALMECQMSDPCQSLTSKGTCFPPCPLIYQAVPLHAVRCLRRAPCRGRQACCRGSRCCTMNHPQRRRVNE